jgi:predicted translin family RNA/ssDNA-binding protein
MTVMMSEQQRVLPQPPYQYRSLNPTQLDLNDNVGRQISTSEQLRQTAYDLSRKVQIATSSARSLVEQHGVVPNNDKGNSNDQETAMMKIVSALQEALAVGNESYSTDGDDAPPSSSSLSDRTPRLANLSNRVEDVVRLLAMMKFLETGDWLSPSECIQRINANHASEATTMTMRIDVTDEEYLAGACMGLCQDLQRYGLGRATARDVASVEAAAALVRRILEYLMQFDFRNGYLRRKYDGTKYALKTLETVLYELSVTGATVSITSANTSDSDGGRPAKKIRTEDSGTDALDTNTNGTTDLKQELDGLRSRIDHRDQLRETLIKRCRDGQKAAKQAIYALHRGDARKAFDLIKECEKCIVNDLLPIVDEEPPLRSGSFANVLEEYAEAKLFYGWLLGKEAIDIDPPKHSENRAVEKANGALLMPEDFTGVVSLLPEEYLGGLCDLTGEIGRYAVQRGTTRDEDGVRDCLEANTAVYEAIQSLERTPNGIGKKLDQLRRSVEKIERMLYEMSLSRAAGMKIATEVTETTNDDIADT